MQIAAPTIDLTCKEADILDRLLSLDNKYILELGCGNAAKTRDIATSGVNRRITALEVDIVAHERNLKITDLPNVEFGLAGAQDIPLQDESVDIVLMFKSLHHVPVGSMVDSLREIRRVLKPAGFAYISEPVFSGQFNEILRLFNDEKEVREAAFRAIKQAVDCGWFDLVEETFFNTPGRYRDFSEFENTIIKASYSQHQLDAGLYSRVKKEFEKHIGEDGALFLKPVRVDLLQKIWSR